GNSTGSFPTTGCGRLRQMTPSMNHGADHHSNREFDIVVFGATSFVGSLTAKYLVRTHPELSLAVAGRNEAKLRDEVERLDLSLAILVADASDLDALQQPAARSRVLISTVGPYTYFGKKVVEACVDSGTHYVDLCGEALFIRR